MVLNEKIGIDRWASYSPDWHFSGGVRFWARAVLYYSGCNKTPHQLHWSLSSIKKDKIGVLQ